MCNTNTIARSIIDSYYNGDQATYYEAIADGERHQCDGTWFVDGCELCERIMTCDCEEQISIKRVSETQRNVYEMWHLASSMSFTGRAKFQFLSTFSGDYQEHPIQSMIETLQNTVLSFEQRRFINCIKEELISVVMHPCRIQAQMEQFDDIESYFTSIGY
jgi:hypothetical protein